MQAEVWTNLNSGQQPERKEGTPGYTTQQHEYYVQQKYTATSGYGSDKEHTVTPDYTACTGRTVPPEYTDQPEYTIPRQDEIPTHVCPDLSNSLQVKDGIYPRYIKRLLDFVLSLLAMVVLSPVMLIIAVLVRIKLGSPVIFKQKRPGLNERIFTLYKFRTMTEERDENGELLPDAARLTKFGRVLRSTSLDELPELFNILKGDMSIVGPRPLLVEYLPLYNEHQRRRHSVRPGLTGLAQVNGRNAITWEEKFSLDIEYVDNISFLLDLKIIFLTVKKVFAREGISSATSATMEPFRGTERERVEL